MIFQRLGEVGLKLKMEKCSFLKEHMQYLSHCFWRRNKISTREIILNPKNAASLHS